MTKTMFITALMLIGAVMLSGPMGAETVEKIIAVVGNRVILSTELASQVQMYMLSTGRQDVDANKLARDLLQQMINDEMILSAARDDTSITVSDAEVQAGLDEHMASLLARFPSEDAFLQELRKEGLTKRALEKRYRPEIHDQLLKQRIVSRTLNKVTVSRQEVEDFYAREVDSLPPIPGRVQLAHLLVKFKISPRTEDSLRQLGENARLMALRGDDFAAVADSFVAQVPTVVGGRIGYIQRAEVVPEFGRAAFNLQPGDISGLVRTEYGWHIIKCHTRSKDSVDVSQILFPVAPSPADTALAVTFADSLYKQLLAGADFGQLAKDNSDDDSSRGIGGELPLMTDEQIRPEFVGPLATIDTGQVTPPIASQAGYHILKLVKREVGRPLDPARDFDVIRNFAKQEKTARMVDDWVVELRKIVYVDIREADLR